ncbi:MAG: inorganic diphosphatase [Ruminococcaceae bacterium]|nr:inorganic diphosphatase [Oscillospiraceae bacterium]
MHIVEAIIEIPMGSRNKYEVNHRTGKIKLDRVLYSAAYYPVEYGYIDNTLSLDGDQLDILVFTTAGTFPGCYMDCKIIGGMDMIDSGEEDTKIIAVNAHDPRYMDMSCLADIAPHYLKELQNFFSTYKSLQHQVTEVIGFFDEEEAWKRICQSRERYLNWLNGDTEIKSNL